jgi:hypothetical protein
MVLPLLSPFPPFLLSLSCEFVPFALGHVPSACKNKQKKGSMVEADKERDTRVGEYFLQLGPYMYLIFYN